MTTEENLKNIPFLSFIISYNCTNECKHCALQGSPNQDKTTIELEDVRRCLEDITSNYLISEVGFFGGEPLLNFDLLISLIEEVKSFGIHKIGLPTNGYWGKNESLAKDYAQKLKKAGLFRISFSVDAFHQEFISIDTIKRALRAAQEAGIEWIAVLSQYLGSQDEKNVFNEQTKAMTDELSKEFEFFHQINSELNVLGRATSELTSYFPMTAALSDKCMVFKVPMFMIDPNGWVFHHSCHGICIGNAKKQSLSKIINEFKYRKHPIIGKVAAKGGLQNLVDMAIEKGYEPLSGYADKCHICSSVRNFLRPYYPNILEPSNLYF